MLLEPVSYTQHINGGGLGGGEGVQSQIPKKNYKNIFS